LSAFAVTVPAMKRFLSFFALAVLGLSARAADFPESWLPVERRVAAESASAEVTVVHFWAPWCPNCKAELSKHGWADFLAVNPDVNVIFVTIWSPEDGKAELTKYGVGEQENFLLLHHPNGARTKEEKMKTFMDQPVNWIPTTWIFREGKLRYALNYGEVRFPLLQQLVRDAADKWQHPPANKADSPKE
jgi:thiol-disulfide isomerase/thioredoxin